MSRIKYDTINNKKGIWIELDSYATLVYDTKSHITNMIKSGKYPMHRIKHKKEGIKEFIFVLRDKTNPYLDPLYAKNEIREIFKKKDKAYKEEKFKNQTGVWLQIDELSELIKLEEQTIRIYYRNNKLDDLILSEENDEYKFFVVVDAHLYSVDAVENLILKNELVELQKQLQKDRAFIKIITAPKMKKAIANLAEVNPKTIEKLKEFKDEDLEIFINAFKEYSKW